MNHYKIILIFLIIFFFIIFFYALINANNNLIKFRVSKTFIEEESVDYNKVRNKYLVKSCDKMCAQEFCDEYQTQKIKYDLCKSCKKEGKCYDQYNGICVPCRNNYTCEQLYGCGNQSPINPIDNYCTKCWN
jgi:hypothetical protein